MFRRAIVVLVVVAGFHAGAPAGARAEGASLVAPPTHVARHAGLPCLGAALLCVRHVGGAVAGVVGHVVAGGVEHVAGSVMSGVVSWAADGAAWLVKSVSKEVERSSSPALRSGWFKDRYGRMVQLSVAVAAVFLLLAVGQAILAQNPWRLARSVLLALPFAVLLAFVAITLVQVSLYVTDWMTAETLAGTEADVRSAFKALAIALLPSSGLAPFALFLVSLVVALLSLLVWFELVMRESAVYVAVAFLPLTLMAAIWERTIGWSRRLAEWLASIILAKFTIATAFALAASAIVGAPESGGGGLSALLAGCSVLLIAALTPWALMRIIPIAEAAAGRTLSRGHVAAAVTAVPGTGSATLVARQLILKQFGSGPSAPAAASDSLPNRLPTLPSPSPGPGLPSLPADRPRPGART